MIQPQALEDLARSLMPPGYGCAVLPLTAVPQPLAPAEEQAVLRAVPKRRREFALGRMVLRQAIAQAGHVLSHQQPIAMRPDRRPDLPSGIRASLSHGGEYCVAIAAPPGGPWVGVDVETMHRTPPPGLAEVVAPFRSDCGDPLLAFCVKEAMFKAQFPLTGRLLDFSEVPAVIRRGRVRACLGDRLIGARWGRTAGHYLAVSLWLG
ncbi:4'-phosphopantetheinyl transferase [Paracoccus sp. NGMCC 1.201697]|uniref:4'-phosphopantetheinyl transferase n=1 Tax=Paracoccus broussonetiae subsp. drimophilus TaxID=3373869 RepID=A0ABW7LEI4_9RHOB